LHLIRELWEQLDSNHYENQAVGKDGKADYRHHNTALGKEEMAV
jgi:hypothetical protein